MGSDKIANNEIRQSLLWEGGGYFVTKIARKNKLLKAKYTKYHNTIVNIKHEIGDDRYLYYAYKLYIS